MSRKEVITLTKVTALGEESEWLVDPDDIEDVFTDETSVNDWTAVKLTNGDEFWVIESVDEVRKLWRGDSDEE